MRLVFCGVRARVLSVPLIALLAVAGVVWVPVVAVGGTVWMQDEGRGRLVDGALRVQTVARAGLGETEHFAGVREGADDGGGAVRVVLRAGRGLAGETVVIREGLRGGVARVGVG